MTRVMMNLLAVAIVLVCMQSSSSHAADEKDPIIGTWKVVSMTVGGGEKLPVPPGMKVTIEKDKMTNSAEGMKETVAIKLDPTKTPKEIDMTVPGPDGAKHLQPAIYKVEGDKLSICVAGADVETSRVEIDPQTGKPKEPGVKPTVKVKVGPRPTAFDAKQGAVMELERVKE